MLFSSTDPKKHWTIEAILNGAYLFCVSLHVVISVLVGVNEQEPELVKLDHVADEHVPCLVVHGQLGAEHLLVGLLDAPTLQELTTDDACKNTYI